MGHAQSNGDVCMYARMCVDVCMYTCMSAHIHIHLPINPVSIPTYLLSISDIYIYIISASAFTFSTFIDNIYIYT